MRLPGLVPWNRRLLGLAWQNPCLCGEDWTVARQGCVAGGKWLVCKVWLRGAIFERLNTSTHFFTYTKSHLSICTYNSSLTLTLYGRLFSSV